MLPYRVTIESNTDELIARQNNTARQSPKLMATAMKRNVGRLKKRILAVRRKEPPPASRAYPLPFTSDKQRRAFFATKGFGHGIPYRRTGALAEAWDLQVVSSERGGEINITNDNPAAEFVYGVHRQRMFDKIGWLDPKTQDAKDAAELQEIVEQTWFTISDETAGVR